MVLAFINGNNVTGQRGVSHWIHPDQQDEYQDIYVLITNYETIASQNQPSQVGIPLLELS